MDGIEKSVESLELQAEARGAVATDSEAVAALQKDITELEATLEEKNTEIEDLQNLLLLMDC